MKIENIEKAAELAAQWREVEAVEIYLRKGPISIRNMRFMSADGELLLDDLTKLIGSDNIRNCIVDVLKELLECKVSALFGQMKALGIDTDAMAVAREESFNKEV
jgi:hypothetical protein